MIGRSVFAYITLVAAIFWNVGGLSGYVVPDYEGLAGMSDVIVLATPLENRDLESFSLPATPKEISAVRVETTFEILLLLKGSLSAKRLVVAHYRYADPETSDHGMVLGPMPVAFPPDRRLRYLMFLKMRDDGKLVSASGWDTALAAKKLEDTIP